MARTQAAGARVVRLFLNWQSTAPAVRPAGFGATDPADPAYAWGAIDRQVRLPSAHGLEPLVVVFAAPGWATDPRGEDERGWGNWRVERGALGQFARAAALRLAAASLGCRGCVTGRCGTSRT